MANKKKVKLVLIQLGSPKAPTAKELRVYLREFLGDPRVIDINPYLWKIILNLFVLPFRPAKSAKLYERIWDGKSFPLITNSWDFTHGLRDFFKKEENQIEDVDLEIDLVFILSNPRFGHLWDEWEKEDPAERASKWILLPIYPQYSEATTAGVMDMFFKELSTRAQIPAFEFINNFHNSKAFIDNSVAQINKSLRENEGTDLLVISFHGIPTRRVLVKKDPYYQQCYETFLLLRKGVEGLPEDKVLFTFQSRFGSEQWLGPYTDEKVIEMIEEKGHKKVGVYCPSFVADCLETTDEIGNELAEEAEEVGGEVYQIPCLNSDPKWIESFGKLVKSGLEKPAGLEKESYQVTKEELKHMPEQKMTSPPLPKET
jgi:ferrochelatase